MALAMKIDRAAYEALHDDLRGFYTAGENDAFVLDVEPLPDQGGLKRALVRERIDRDTTRDELKTIEAHNAAIAAIDPDPVVARTKYNEVLARAERGVQPPVEAAARDAEHVEQIAALNAQWDERFANIERQILDEGTQAILGVAMAKADVVMPDILLAHIRKRLRAERVGERTILTVLDENGLPRVRADGSALTIDEWLREIQINDETLSRCFGDPVAWRIAMMAKRRGPRGSNGNGAH